MHENEPDRLSPISQREFDKWPGPIERERNDLFLHLFLSLREKEREGEIAVRQTGSWITVL